MACRAYDAETPYSDPHIAAPGLWALLRTPGCVFEVSTAVSEESTPIRKGLEALEISRHRIEHGGSTLNFGRMPDGWRRSSGNNQRLVERGKRLRGGPDPALERIPDAPPPPSLDGDPFGTAWLGLGWTSWTRTARPSSQLVGLYRGHPPVSRCCCTSDKAACRADQPSAPTGAVSARHQVVLVLTTSILVPQLLEQENDLIASHVLMTGVPRRLRVPGTTPSATTDRAWKRTRVFRHPDAHGTRALRRTDGTVPAVGRNPDATTGDVSITPRPETCRLIVGLRDDSTPRLETCRLIVEVMIGPLPALLSPASRPRVVIGSSSRPSMSVCAIADTVHETGSTPSW